MDQADWKKKLTPKQYAVLRLKGTEAPFSGKFVNHQKEGIYACVACGSPLFSSGAKFESGSGWPSFTDVAKNGTVELRTESGHGMKRVEVTCANCGGHLGHLFDDGPANRGGKRYCVNSCCLSFKNH